MNNDAVELRKIRDRMHALGDVHWLLSVDGDASFIESRNRNGELNEVMRFHRGATPEEIDFMIHAPDTVIFLLGLVDRAIARLGGNRPQQVNRRPKNYAAEATMKCDEPAFKVFLEERHGLERPLTTDRVVQKLRTLLGITSRRELNTDGAAADRWQSLRADFDAWRGVAR